MENFGAQGTGDATSVSTDKVASSDIYLGIIGWRYGYVPAGMSQSVTHQEFEAAQRLGMPRYLFLANPSTDAPDGPDAIFPSAVRDPEHRAQLDAFRSAIGLSHVVDFFTTPDDLATRVATALNSYLISLKEEEMSHRRAAAALVAAARLRVRWPRSGGGVALPDAHTRPRVRGNRLRSSACPA